MHEADTARIEAKAVIPPPMRKPGLVLAVLAGAQLMVVLDITIVTIAVPSIQRDLGFSPTSLQWVINAYTLAFGGLLLLGGRLSDLLGRRGVFQVGAAVFVLFSLSGGLAHDQGWLIASRAAQGVGAALLSPAAFSLVATTFPEGPARNRAFGVFGAVSGAASAIGVIAGGLLTQFLSWRWVFFVNIPLGALVLLGSAAVLIKTPRVPRKLDVWGAITVTVGCTALVNGAINAASAGWTSLVTLGSLGIAVVLLGSFVRIQVRHAQPLISPRLFASRRRSGAFVVQLLNNAVILGFYYFLSQFAQEVLHYNALITGLALLPAPACVVLAAQVASRLLARVGPLPLLVAGTVLVGAGLVYVSFMSPESTYAGRLLPALILVATGFGAMVVPVTVTALSGVAPPEMGMATGTLNTCQQVGSALGLAVLVTAAAQVSGAGSRHPSAAMQAHAWGSALALGSLLTLASLVVAVVAIRRQKQPAPRAS
jgi:EmrB/QacA subfamily drug resistance transporter